MTKNNYDGVYPNNEIQKIKALPNPFTNRRGYGAAYMGFENCREAILKLFTEVKP